MTNKERIAMMNADELAELLTPKDDCRECILSRDMCDEYYDQDSRECKAKVKRWLEQEVLVRREKRK